MQPYGSDRVRKGDGDQVILACMRPKANWYARIEKTLTTARHPGTAIVWDERIFEIVGAEPGPAGGVRYILEPWRDEHVIRTSESYDAESEAWREAEYRAAIAREKKRKSANFGGIFTGLLPAVVQEHLASELGILPAKLTSLSLVLPVIAAGWIINEDVRFVMKHQPAPLWLNALAFYLLLESAIRFFIVWTQRRPIASVFGFVAYLIYYLLTGAKALSPFTEQRGEKLYFSKPPDDVAAQDAFSMREPFLTLLSPAEQNALAQRYGFDYRKDARMVALAILVVAIIGVVSSVASLPRFSAVVSLLAAGALGVEQIVRIAAFSRGPRGSVLGVVVRPFTRKLLR